MSFSCISVYLVKESACQNNKSLIYMKKYTSQLTHFYPPLRFRNQVPTCAVRETASLGIMGESRVPPLKPLRDDSVLSRETLSLGQHMLELGCENATVGKNGLTRLQLIVCLKSGVIFNGYSEQRLLLSVHCREPSFRPTFFVQSYQVKLVQVRIGRNRLDQNELE